MKVKEIVCNVGKCKAWCCKQFWIQLDKPPSKDMSKYFELHGIKVTGTRITIPLKCNYLTPDNKCCIYDDRPKICKEFMCKNPENSDVS